MSVKDIFIVDDDESVRNAIRRLLSSCGYRVEAFPSAAAFLDSVHMESEGIVVLDIKMPGMDGLQLQKRLNDFNSPKKIIFITGHAGPGEREEAMAQGACGFLSKPFNDQSLLDLVAECQRGADEKKASNH